MTYRRWFELTCSQWGVETDRVDLIMYNQGLVPNDTADVLTAKKALCKEIALLLPLQNVSEGSMSLSYNWDAIKKWYAEVSQQVGLNNTLAPKVKNKSNIW